MEKTYYKIELRIARKEQKLNTGKIANYYYSNGYIVITGKAFEGFLTDDYIKGNLEGKEIIIKVFEELETKAFSEEFPKSVKISNNSSYFLVSKDNDNEFALINFIHKIDDSSKQRELEKTIKTVKGTRQIP